MAVNKVVYGDQTIIDLTDSTLSSGDQILSGTTAYDRSGVLRSGTAQVGTKVYDGDSTTDTPYDNLFMDTVASGVDAVSVGLDMDLLWENENTTITFAPQTIQLSLADYKYLFIKFINAKGGNGKYNLIATMGERFFAGVMSYNAKMEYRAFTTSNSGIEFEKGQLIKTYGSTSSIDNNDCMIPYQIYGIRGKINDLTGD